MTTDAPQEMVTLPRELVELMLCELGQWHESLIAHEVGKRRHDEVASLGAKVWKLLREQYPIPAPTEARHDRASDLCE